MVCSSNNNLILKISVGEDGVTHRANLSSIWDEFESKVSYSLLVDLIFKYTFPGNTTAGSQKKYDVIVTYVDEDGDKVNISSDVELADAVGQFENCDPPILRIKAVVKRKGDINFGSSETGQFLCRSDSIGSHRDSYSSFFAASFPSPPKEYVLELDSIASNLSLSSAEDKAFAENYVSARTVELATQLVSQIASIITPKNIKDQLTPKGIFDEKFPSEVNTSFIHGRHTCDKCMCHPIVGIRYHATNRHDFDVCQKCIVHFKNTDIKFVPEELDCDLFFQKRWDCLFSALSDLSACQYKTNAVKNEDEVPRQRNETMKQMDQLYKDCLEFKEYLETIEESKSQNSKHPIYDKYIKMLKMKVPMEAVKHALRLDLFRGFDDVSNPPPSCSTNHMYEKYSKMLKVGVSPEAVKNEMLSDGFDPNTLDAQLIFLQPKERDVLITKCSENMPDKNGAETQGCKRGILEFKKKQPAPDNVEYKTLINDQEKADECLISSPESVCNLRQCEGLPDEEAGSNQDQNGGKCTVEDITQNDIISPVAAIEQLELATSTTIPPSKWEKELTQLHEMGFRDYERMIRILDNLEAARMEAGVTGDLSLEDVISHVVP